MGPEPTRGQPRNGFAVAGLWTVGATWLGVFALLFYAEFLDHEPSENIGWALLGVGTTGFVLTLAGFTVARTRGEWGLAWAALALALAFATMLSPFLFYGFSGGE